MAKKDYNTTFMPLLNTNCKLAQSHYTKSITVLVDIFSGQFLYYTSEHEVILVILSLL